MQNEKRMDSKEGKVMQVELDSTVEGLKGERGDMVKMMRKNDD